MVKPPEPKRARPTETRRPTNSTTSAARSTRSVSAIENATNGSSAAANQTAVANTATQTAPRVTSNRRPPAPRDVKWARRKHGVFEPTPSWKRLGSLAGMMMFAVLIGLAVAATLAIIGFAIATALG